MKRLLDRSYRVFHEREERIYREVILSSASWGKAYFTLSLPIQIPKSGLPCIVIIGGLKTGRESLRFIPDHGCVALVGYEYPKPLRFLRKLKLIWRFFSVRKALFSVPKQILAIVQFLQQETWWNQKPMNLMGYSFGSLFLPVTYVSSQKGSFSLGPGVMAYGGAGIRCLLEAQVPGPKWLKKMVGKIGEALFYPIDPLEYAPKMQGKFLLINGKKDTQVPFACARTLQRLIKEPKTIVDLETEHMSPENAELTRKLIDLSRRWLASVEQ